MREEQMKMEKVKKAINVIKENKWIHYAIIVVIGVILSIPLCKKKRVILVVIFIVFAKEKC